MTWLAIFSIFIAALALITTIFKHEIFLYCLGMLLTPVWPILFGFGAILVAFSQYSGSQMDKFCKFTANNDNFDQGFTCWLNEDLKACEDYKATKKKFYENNLIGMTAKRKINDESQELALDFDLEINTLSNNYMCSEACPCGGLNQETINKITSLSTEDLLLKY